MEYAARVQVRGGGLTIGFKAKSGESTSRTIRLQRLAPA